LNYEQLLIHQKVQTLKWTCELRCPIFKLGNLFAMHVRNEIGKCALKSELKSTIIKIHLVCRLFGHCDLSVDRLTRISPDCAVLCYTAMRHNATYFVNSLHVSHTRRFCKSRVINVAAWALMVNHIVCPIVG
jgi:hypothetical protein